MSDSELDRARKAWGEELLMERESAIHERNLKISQLEYEVRDLRESAKKLTQQNALFKAQYPYTAYASEVAELKVALDQMLPRISTAEGAEKHYRESYGRFKEMFYNAEDYIHELYRLNPYLQLPNGKRFDEDEDPVA